LRWTNRRIWKK